jgi:hypothetical protein
MSKKGHNPWTHTFHSSVQKGVMDRKHFFQNHGYVGRFKPEFKLETPKLEKTK